jgi:peptide/nickel transport system ATP-binding protein
VGAVCATERPPDRLATDGHRIACHIPLADLARMQAAGLTSEATTS